MVHQGCPVKLNNSHTLHTSNNARMLRLNDTGLTPNPAQEELLKLPNTTNGAQGAWHFNKIEGGCSWQTHSFNKRLYQKPENRL